MFYISLSSYDYKEVKSSVEQCILALMRGNKECKVDCITNTFFKLDTIDDMYLEVYLCDIEGHMISDDKFSMYLCDIATDKITAIIMSMMAQYMQALYVDTLKYYGRMEA
jgi:hypothetical protein